MTVRERADILIGHLLWALRKAPTILEDEGQSLVVTKTLRDQILSLLIEEIKGCEMTGEEIKKEGYPTKRMYPMHVWQFVQNAIEAHTQKIIKTISEE